MGSTHGVPPASNPAISEANCLSLCFSWPWGTSDPSLERWNPAGHPALPRCVGLTHAPGNLSWGFRGAFPHFQLNSPTRTMWWNKERCFSRRMSEPQTRVLLKGIENHSPSEIGWSPCLVTPSVNVRAGVSPSLFTHTQAGLRHTQLLSFAASPPGTPGCFLHAFLCKKTSHGKGQYLEDTRYLPVLSVLSPKLASWWLLIASAWKGRWEHFWGRANPASCLDVVYICVWEDTR